MVDIVSEIRKDMIKHKYAHIWKKYGLYLFIILVITVVSGLGYLLYKQYNDGKILETGKKYVAFLKNESFKSAEEKITMLDGIVKDGSGGLVAIAEIKQAKLLVEQNKINDALVTLNNLAKNSSNDEAIRSLAKLNILYVLLEYRNKTSEEIKAIESMFKELLVKSNPWYFSAEDAHVMWLVSQEKYKEAYSIISELLANKETPETIKLKMQELKLLILRKVPELG